MKTVRLAALAAMSCCALMLLAAGPAAAQTSPPKFTQKVKVTGTKGFKGTYTIERFVREGNRAFAVGTLKGRLRGRNVRREDVRMPASIGNAQTAGASQIPPTPNACQLLNLVLGPIDLNLLGLRLRTNQIRLLLEAVPSGGPVPGGLLGDLLCAINNLLAPSANTPLAQLTQLLNALLALSPRGPA
jgi:hypothetical protein